MKIIIFLKSVLNFLKFIIKIIMRETIIAAKGPLLSVVIIPTRNNTAITPQHILTALLLATKSNTMIKGKARDKTAPRITGFPIVEADLPIGQGKGSNP